MLHASATWRRLDVFGNDTCHLKENSFQHYFMNGVAASVINDCPAWCSYWLLYSEQRKFLSATIGGWASNKEFQTVIERPRRGIWYFDGVEQPELNDLIDLDLGFTPATNWFQLQQLGPEIGVRRELPVAWWNLGEQKLIRLPQFYTRRSPTTVWYESPEHGYEALLDVSLDGFVRNYPELWQRLEIDPPVKT